jgi:ubiquitin thioesterase protein OTUB1
MTAADETPPTPLVTMTLYDATKSSVDRPATPSYTAVVSEQVDNAAALDRQHADILEEVNRAPLLDDARPLDVCAAEFSETHPVFCAKLLDLHAQGMTQLRRVRGDGNCFYRCCLFGLLEGAVRAASPLFRRAAVDRARAVFARAKRVMLAVGYQEYVLEDPMMVLKELLDAVEEPSFTLSSLEARFREDANNGGGVAYVLFLLRMCAASEIISREEFYYPFIIGISPEYAMPASAREYCQNNVEPVASEADHVSVTALCAALSLVVRVAYVDGGAPAAAEHDAQPLVTWHEFDGPTLREQTIDSSPIPTNAPPIHLLYRPGHYDLLYPGDQGQN